MLPCPVSVDLDTDAPGFKAGLLRRAFEKARKDLFVGTDEASLVERLEQVEVSVVVGTDRNIKITKPTDMDLARLYLALETRRSKFPDDAAAFPDRPGLGHAPQEPGGR